MPFIIGNETFEKLGTFGSSTNLVVYLNTVFNLKSVTATTVVNVFNGTTNLAPLLGAFLCDTYFGRYKTLGFASVASFLGMSALALTAAITNLHPPKCVGKDNSQCVGPTIWQFAFLLCGFGLIAIGAGGIRPCNLAFGAEQFNPNTESGKRGMSSFFNWYYFTYTFAVMVSATGIVYVQSDVSWAIGLAIPAFLMFLSCAVFFLGTRIYVIVEPEGSPMTSVAQVLVVAVKTRLSFLRTLLFPFSTIFLPNLSTPSSSHKSVQAAIVTEKDQINLDGSSAKPWRLCSIQRVEEVKCLTRIIPIWASAIIYHVPLIQQQTYAVLQALQLDRRLGTGSFEVPAATFIIFTMLALTIWIAFYDRILVPFLQRLTGKEVDSHFSREWGLESYSQFFVLPQLALAGLSEGFNYVSQIEFYYKQFPENMRSIAGSSFFAGAALANFLSGFLVSTVHKVTSSTKSGDWLSEDLNKAKLDYFYCNWCFGGIELCIFSAMC
ncbi:hypothetical protein GH714_012211 [Hevea brasiliensis]|uniref:Major facilitator superfamily (MFS) profile domain-containing protein n=1 Tax=Hevea brasiliensis TaxID=3981 RepID=A0A6A6M825_HEVBR|nr:hypothetical protein GH714_012211 [Hevea brasiliensis]